MRGRGAGGGRPRQLPSSGASPPGRALPEPLAVRDTSAGRSRPSPSLCPQVSALASQPAWSAPLGSSVPVPGVLSRPPWGDTAGGRLKPADRSRAPLPHHPGTGTGPALPLGRPHQEQDQGCGTREEGHHLFFDQAALFVGVRSLAPSSHLSPGWLPPLPTAPYSRAVPMVQQEQLPASLPKTLCSRSAGSAKQRNTVYYVRERDWGGGGECLWTFPPLISLSDGPQRIPLCQGSWQGQVAQAFLWQWCSRAPLVTPAHLRGLDVVEGHLATQRAQGGAEEVQVPGGLRARVMALWLAQLRVRHCRLELERTPDLEPSVGTELLSHSRPLM